MDTASRVEFKEELGLNLLGGKSTLSKEQEAMGVKATAWIGGSS
jgi:hypothetical protein